MVTKNGYIPSRAIECIREAVREGALLTYPDRKEETGWDPNNETTLFSVPDPSNSRSGDNKNRPRQKQEHFLTGITPARETRVLIFNKNNPPYPQPYKSQKGIYKTWRDRQEALKRLFDKNTTTVRSNNDPLESILGLRPYNGEGEHFHPSKRDVDYIMTCLHVFFIQEYGEQSTCGVFFPHCNISQAIGVPTYLGVIRRALACEKERLVYKKCVNHLHSDVQRLCKEYSLRYTTETPKNLTAGDITVALDNESFPQILDADAHWWVKAGEKNGGVSRWNLDIPLSRRVFLQAATRIAQFSARHFSLTRVFDSIRQDSNCHPCHQQIEEFQRHLRFHGYEMVGEDLQPYLSKISCSNDINRNTRNLVVWQGYFVKK